MSEGGAVDERTGGEATDPRGEATQATGGATETRSEAAPDETTETPAVPTSAAAAAAEATPAAATPAEGSSPPPRSDAVTRIESLADDLLPALIGRLESSALGELEVRTADWRVRLCKAAGGEDRAAALAVSVAGTSGPAGGLAAAGHDHGAPLAHELATTGAHLASAVGALTAGGRGAGTAADGSRGVSAVAAPHLPVPTRVLAGGTGTGTGTGAGAGAGTAAPGHPGLSGTAIVHVAISPAVGFLVVRDGYGPGRAVHAGEVVGQVDCLGVMRDVTAPEDGVIARNLAEQGEAVEYGQPLFDIEPGPPQPGSPQPGPSRPASPAPEGR